MQASVVGRCRIFLTNVPLESLQQTVHPLADFFELPRGRSCGAVGSIASKDHPWIGGSCTSTNYARFVDGLFDADVVYGEPLNREDLIVIPLSEEIIAPLCSPEMAKKIKSARDLFRLPLIRSDLKRIQWIDWFEINDLGPPPAPSISFDRSFLAVDAAANGVGITLESNVLARRELASGRLVDPFAGKFRDNRYIGHYVAYPKSGSQRRLARNFSDWLIRQL